jgi:hypothetical protein
MVPDVPAAEPSGMPATPRRAASPFRTVAAVQGLYFLLTGLWPLFGIDSFQAVTGRKTDLWLVYTVGMLVSVIGLTLLVAAGSRRITPEIAILAIGSAAGLAAIDVIFVFRGVISWIYLLDAAAEVALLGWWVLTHTGTPARRRAPEYPHVQALLARGQSVAPNGPIR